MISIVVVHYGDHWDLTNAALRSLFKYGEDFEVICVVNNGELPPNHARYPAQYFQIPDAPYSVAVNAGVRRTDGGHLLILNNDITMTDKYCHLIGEQPLEGPKILTIRGGYIEGWCLSVDRGLWDLLNGFDIRLRNSWEDVDFCQRARRIGYDYHLIKLPITHKWGATRNVTIGANRWDNDNQRIYAEKKERMDALLGGSR